MNKLWTIKCFFCIVLIVISCKEPFDPKISPVQSNYLVVEGNINVNGFTSIALSRTLPLKDSVNAKPELNAQVTITGSDNSVFEVRDAGNGTYLSDSLVLNPNQKYRLHIKTTAGGEYLSQYSSVLQTPAIDSVSWKSEDNGVRIYVNTHDATNNSRYYKWDYEETWEIHSAYENDYEYVNGNVIARTDPDAIRKLYYCWRSQNSTNILLGSSAQLSDNVISMAPLILIPDESEKLAVRYSILVKQYSLDRSAYDFYTLMKSNTETLGSVFDPLPSEITGNITCVSNPVEKVIGYISAASVTQKRIFISQSEVHSTFSLGCYSITVPNNKDSFKLYYDGEGFLPYQCNGCPMASSYYSSLPRCIDCTLRGTSVKPSFW